MHPDRTQRKLRAKFQTNVIRDREAIAASSLSRQVAPSCANKARRGGWSCKSPNMTNISNLLTIRSSEPTTLGDAELFKAIQSYSRLSFPFQTEGGVARATRPSRSATRRTERKQRFDPTETVHSQKRPAVFRSDAGSTGDPPVPFGDSPDGTEATPQVNRNASFAKKARQVPVSGANSGSGDAGDVKLCKIKISVPPSKFGTA